jgi:hypothetical protein
MSSLDFVVDFDGASKATLTTGARMLSTSHDFILRSLIFRLEREYIRSFQ